MSSVSYSGSTTGNRNPIARSDRSIFGTYDRLDNTFRGKIGFKYKVPGVDGLTLGTDINLTLLDRSENLENHIMFIDKMVMNYF